jgi:hypothetical protein
MQRIGSVLLSQTLGSAHLERLCRSKAYKLVRWHKIVPISRSFAETLRKSAFLPIASRGLLKQRGPALQWKIVPDDEEMLNFLKNCCLESQCSQHLFPKSDVRFSEKNGGKSKILLRPIIAPRVHGASRARPPFPLRSGRSRVLRFERRRHLTHRRDQLHYRLVPI